MSDNKNKEEQAGNGGRMANNRDENNFRMSNDSLDSISLPDMDDSDPDPMVIDNDSNGSNEAKRLAFKQTVEKYFYQLRTGCGDEYCENPFCASSGKFEPMSPNEAAALSLQLLNFGAELCIKELPNKRMDQSLSSQTSNLNLSSAAHSSTSIYSDIEPSSSASSSSSSSASVSSHGSGLASASGSSINSSRSNTGMMASNVLLSPNTTSDSASTCDTEIIPLLVEDSGVGMIDNNPYVETVDVDMDANVKQPDKKKMIPWNEGSMIDFESIEYLNEEIIDQLIEEGKKENNFEHLIYALNEVLSDIEYLGNSFVLKPAKAVVLKGKPKIKSEAKTNENAEGKANAKEEAVGGAEANEANEASSLNKEVLRSRDNESEKDVDSKRGDENEEICDEPMPSANSDKDLESLNCIVVSDSESESSFEEESITIAGRVFRRCPEIRTNETLLTVDFESLRRIKKKIYDLQCQDINDAINKNLIILATLIRHQYKYAKYRSAILHCILVAFELITNTSKSFIEMQFMDRALPKLCFTTTLLPSGFAAKLIKIWAVHCKDNLRSLLDSLQQLITLKVMTDEEKVHENQDIISAAKMLRLIYYVSIVAGENDTNDFRREDVEYQQYGPWDGDEYPEWFFQENESVYSQKGTSLLPWGENLIEFLLNISSFGNCVPFIPFEDFYNDALSDVVDMKHDYVNYRRMVTNPNSENDNFSFMSCAFILRPACKVIILNFESQISMDQLRFNPWENLPAGYRLVDEIEFEPELRIKVRRDHIIEDVLMNIEKVAALDPETLRKQLIVEFVGEQGVDEGGVSKEFFQLITEEIFNPDFGMFVQLDETKAMWFNSAPLENEAQFSLVGIILGLAIYNNIILDIHFPRVVYRKLMDGQGTYDDLKDWSPTIFNSLESMLKYEGDDMAEVFMQTFNISYQNVFGDAVEVELKPNGGDIFVEQHNKQEFADLYADFLLNKNIDRQFKAFKKGFDMVTYRLPLRLLFRPDEIELVVCGSRTFDFLELEQHTEYEGFTKDSEIVKDFWAIVHAMSEQQKRKLLEFTTGSNRVPVGGFRCLQLLITRNGPDSDRLPTSHTCFNVLLLPEYNSKEKLEERLLKAINYSKGFGLL